MHGLALTDDGKPMVVPLAPDAADMLPNAVADFRARDAAGMLAGAIGKAPGHVLRLSLVLEFLWWCGRPGEVEPGVVSAAAVAAAAGLVDGYFLPLAERAFGDAAALPVERQAATLARWILRTRPDVVKVRAISETARLPGLREASAIHATCAHLKPDGWPRLRATAAPAAGRVRITE